MMDKASTLGWEGPAASIAYDPEAVAARLHDKLDRPCYVVRNGRGLGMTNDGMIVPPGPAALRWLRRRRHSPLGSLGMRVSERPTV